AYHGDLRSFPTRRSSDLSWLLELDEEELQRQLYRLEEVLKREEEIAQAMEGEVDVEEDESQLRRLEEDCMVMSDLQEREDVYRRDRKSTRLNSSHVKISY